MWEWDLNGLADSTELLVSELVTNAVKTMAGREDQAAVRLRLSSDNASPHRSLGCRPAAASTQRSRQRRHARPSRRGWVRVVPGGGAKYPLGLVPHPGANRQGRLVRDRGVIARAAGVGEGAGTTVRSDE